MTANQRIYAISCDDIPEGKMQHNLTDEEFIELSVQSFDSVEAFVEAFNMDIICPYPSNDYLRII